MIGAMQTREARRWIDAAIIAVIAVLAIGMLLPFAWLFSMSFKPVSEAYRLPPTFWPTNLDLANYAEVLASRLPFLQIYANSLLIAVVVTVGQLVTCTLAAFAFARLEFRGRDMLFFILLVGLMFPAQVTILPIYLGYARVGLINQPIGLALMYLTSSFGVFLMRQFMPSQPKALEEAALMDGAGYLKIFWRISVPQLRPALGARHHHLHPDLERRFPGERAARPLRPRLTLPVAMDVLRGDLGSGNLSTVMAAMSMSILPVVLTIPSCAENSVIEGIDDERHEGTADVWSKGDVRDLDAVDAQFATRARRSRYVAFPLGGIGLGWLLDLG